MPVWEWENPPEDVDVSRGGRHRVSTADIEMLRAARAHYEQMYRKAGGIATRARIVGFLNSEAAPLLRGSYTDATGRQLHRATGGLVAVAGICAYDSDAHGLAQRYFHQALRLAKASGDRGLGAYVIALLVNQSLFMREYRQSVAFAEAALRAAGRHITPALASDLYAMQAKAYAHLGDGSSALSCIRRAEQAAERIRRGYEPDETGYVQPGLVNVQVAEALLSLGDLSAAREHAAAAVDNPAHDRGRVHRLAMLSQIELRQGNADKAVATAVRNGRAGPGNGVPAAARQTAGGARTPGAQRLRGHVRGGRTHRRGTARTAVEPGVCPCRCERARAPAAPTSLLRYCHLLGGRWQNRAVDETERTNCVRKPLVQRQSRRCRAAGRPAPRSLPHTAAARCRGHCGE